MPVFWVKSDVTLLKSVLRALDNLDESTERTPVCASVVMPISAREEKLPVAPESWLVRMVWSVSRTVLIVESPKRTPAVFVVES